MQRLDLPTRSYNYPETVHPRSSATTPTTVLFTMSTVAALTASLMNNHIDLEPPCQSLRITPVEYDDPERVHIHSGPFNVEGFECPISFLDDGFTLMAGEDRFRMHSIQAYFSHLPLEKVHELLCDTGGITKIECGDSVIMHSGNKRSLEIRTEDLVRIIETAREGQQNIATITNIPYKLKIESGLSTCLIPRYGQCSIDFKLLPKQTRSLMAAGTR